MQRLLRHEAHAQNKAMPSGTPISEGIMTALKPACGAIAAAFFFCANPVQPPITSKVIDSNLPGTPIIYSLKTNISGRIANVAVVQMDPTDSTKTFYFRAHYGDGSGDSGVFVIDSGIIGTLSHTYAAPGKYGIQTSLCKNPEFNGSNPRSDTVTIQ